MGFSFHYSRESDVLSIYNYDKKSPEESVEISEYLVLDIGEGNKIVGVEIFDASEFFGALNNDVDKELLGNLIGVDIEQREFRNNWFLAIVLKTKDKVVRQPMPLLRKSEYVGPLAAA